MAIKLGNTDITFDELLNNSFYSSSEKKTSKRSIENKPVYKKSFAVTFTNQYTEDGFYYYWFNSGINNIKDVVKIDSTINLVSRTETVGRLYTISFLNDGRIQLGLSTIFGSTRGKSIVNIEYTKTTD